MRIRHPEGANQELKMKPILLLYGTREGQTERVANRLAEMFRARGLTSEIVNAANASVSLPVADYGAAIVLASAHLGRHEEEVTGFVKQRRVALSAIPSAFVSVSLSQARAEDKVAAPEQRAKGGSDAKTMIQTFAETTGWKPDRTKAVAGALPYSRYNWFLRLVMKRIARKAGAPADASRDYEFTDWKELERFAAELSELFVRAPQTR